MSAVNLEPLRTPLGSDSPSGMNLEYDPRFVEMIRLSEGTREQQYGATIIPAAPPDWRAIDQLATELAAETRDLRVAVVLIESQTHSDSLEGLASGLELLRCWICDFWDSVHPQLDEDEDNDPFVRINSLGRLCEPERLPALIGKMPLVEAPPHVVVTLDDVRAARGERQLLPKTDRPTSMEIEAAFLAPSLGELRQRFELCQRSETALSETIKFLDQTAGNGVWNAEPLVERIGRCTSTLKDNLRRRLSVSDAAVVDVSVDSGSEADSKLHSAQWDDTAVDQSISQFSRISVHSREDVQQVLDAATRYFEIHEPSSPIPLLLRRAKRLINQDFVDILRDLAPDALVQAKNLAGELEE